MKAALLCCRSGRSERKVMNACLPSQVIQSSVDLTPRHNRNFQTPESALLNSLHDHSLNDV